jgi:hypothetical protein
MIEKFVNSKLPTTFISIDGRYDSCSFLTGKKNPSKIKSKPSEFLKVFFYEYIEG